jgi:GR25 family glycosyltransferase involved in LPS biosynthesis
LGIDEIILINLKRRHDRLQLFKQRSHLTDDQFTRLDAFDGKLLRWHEELDKIFRNNKFGSHASQIGCPMSHLSVWQRIASSNCKLCLVLEDDALFSDRWIDTWNHEYYPELPQSMFGFYVLYG